MLYQVATGLLSSDEVAAPIRSILRRQKNVTVLMAEVVGVDPHARVVGTREGTVAYDYLVLATGIEYNYFGHEEWKALAPGLASVDDADRIRGKILTAFESADRPVVLVRLTEKGLNVYRRLTRRILALHREQWSALSETELRELRRLLVKVLGEDQSQAKLRTVGRTVGQPGAATVA